MQNPLIPSLWFSATQGDISKILEYYKTIFQDLFEAGNIMNLGQTPSGRTEICEVKILGQRYTLMSTEGDHDHFNDSFALTVECEDQTEIDKYWNYFIQEGKEVQCGWCNDKYGLRWQVIPQNLAELMSKPNAQNVLMNQKKIIIEEYLK